MKAKIYNKKLNFYKKCIARVTITAILLSVIILLLPSYSIVCTQKSILMIEVMKSANLVSKAKDLGYNVILFTANKDQRIIEPETLSKADSHVVVDTSDTKAVVQAAEELARKQKIDAVIPGNEYFVVPSAMVAEKLGLRSMSVEAARKARNKDLTLLTLQEKGVPTPRFKIVKSPEEILEHANYIKFPAILKPVDSAASDKVFKVSSIEEAQEKLSQITHPDGKFAMWGYPLRNIALFEEYVPGQEYSVEGFVVNNKPTIYSITKRELNGFMESADIIGSFDDIPLKTKIESYVFDTLRALGVNYAPFHMELRLSESGNPLIMEVGARIPGGGLPTLIDIAKDTNFAKDYFEMLVNPNCILKTPQLKRFAARKFFYNPEMKILNKFDGLEILREQPWIYEVQSYRKVGDVLPDEPLFLKRLGHVIFVGESWKDIDSKSKFIDQTAVYK